MRRSMLRPATLQLFTDTGFPQDSPRLESVHQVLINYNASTVTFNNFSPLGPGVHFDSDVIRAYLRETARVLRRGGRALFHHSNYGDNPGGDVHDNPRWRNFMTENLFQHYAAKCGLRYLASQVLDWDGHPALDCLTLLELPVDHRFEEWGLHTNV